MKVLSVFNHYLERGGEARAVASINDSLDKVADVAACEFASADWIGRGAPPRWQQALRMIRNPASVRKLRDLQQSAAADLWLVHNVFPVGSGAVYSEAKRLQVPVVQYLHNFRPFSVNGYLWAGRQIAPQGLRKNYWPEIRAGSWQNSRVRTAWFAFVLRWGHALGWWRGVKAWIAVSNFMRERFIEAGVPAQDIFALRHFWRARGEFSPGAGQHYLFLGRLTEEKGVGALLAAWALLEKKKRGAGPRLVIAGDGPLRGVVSAAAEQMPSVTYAGELDGAAKEEALREARAVIVPSLWWEGLGLVAYEAYDHGRPVLAARSGGLTEIVSDGETGRLHDPGDVEQLAAQVEEMEQNRTLRAEMGSAGRRWLLAHADEAVWQRRFLEIAAHARGR
ncbi:MAG: glycosyltransferase family 4 protein [Chthoniobacterales bacterium]|nr:glycosyltransferase family 4 protein [Chthoniobacterales bacterium]